MPSGTYSLTHPIVFVFDPSADNVAIPEYDPAVVASSTVSCISVRAISDIDGDVTISLESGRMPEIDPSAIPVYSGYIESPGRRIAIVSSENTSLLEVEVMEPTAHIRVFVDDEAHPGKIRVMAS